MNADQYPVSLPYGSTEEPYGTPELPYHRGEDLATPKGTKLVIEDTLCALTGATGYTFGAHLHIQEWRDSVFTTREPRNAFKPGTVVAVSNDTTQQWGKHFTVRNSDGWNTTYCHLDQIYVTNGQVIKEKTMSMTLGVMDSMKFLAMRQKVTQAEFERFKDHLEEYVQYLTRVQEEHNVIPRPPTGTVADPKLEALGKAIKEYVK